MKVELYLRMAGVAYKTQETLDLRRAPKGKLPWIESEGHAYADSQQIVEYLEKEHGSRVPGVAATDHDLHALRRTTEEGLYFAIVYFRWLNEPSWEQTRQLYFGSLRRPLRDMASLVGRRALGKQLRAQGYGRHRPDEVLARGAADLDALAARVPQKLWLHGDSPGLLDAVCYAFVANIIELPIETPLKEHALGLRTLVDHAHRMRSKFGAERAEVDDTPSPAI